jgi:ATP-dependent exoDNAse (exonuclease V) beta subunit
LIEFLEAARNLRQELLREQRRLFYVAMTRPTDILVLSSFITIENHLAFKIGAKIQSGRRGQRRTIASRFFAELGPTTPPSRDGTEFPSAS